jgi:hypothetical protein
MRTRKYFVFTLAVLLGALTWNGCDMGSLALDETNLEKVAIHYNRPGQKKSLSSEKVYGFFSEKTKAQITRDDWVKMRGGNDNNYVTSVRLLGSKEASGNRYAIVSVTHQLPEKDGKTYRKTIATTWILESGKWRRLWLPKSREELTRALRSDNNAAIRAKAGEWLSVDPFSVEAYAALGAAMDRGAGHSAKRGDRSLNDIVQAMLAIDPEDTTVLYCAAIWSDSPSDAKSFLKKMEGTKSYSTAAFGIAAKINDPGARLRFLEGMEVPAELVLLKMESLAKLGEMEEFRKVAADEGGFDKLKIVLDGQDAGTAADWAGRLGAMFHNAKDDSGAWKWLEYGMKRDPNRAEVRKLARLLGRPKKG